MSWYWNKITDNDSSRYATTTAVWVSYFLAVVSASLAIASFVRHEFSYEIFVGLALVNAVLFAGLGWWIGRLSRAGVVFGLSLYLLEWLVAVFGHRFSVSDIAPNILGIIFLAAYINALRGAFSYRKWSRPRSAREQGVPRK